MEDKKKIGIIGLGMVGGALEKYYQSLGFEIFRKDLNLDEDVNQAEVIFISVPTPYEEEKNGYNLDAIRENLALIDDGKLVVLKSTIIPGTTDSLQNEFPTLKLLFNPEFLTEATTDLDFADPDRQIIGHTEASKADAAMILDLLPTAPCSEIMPAKEAEMIKLSANAFMSMKVIYYNQIFDLCQSGGLDYDLVKKGVTSDRRIGPSHSDVFHGGKRGYEGKCLPKDMNALLAYAEQIGVRPELLHEVRSINERLLGREKRK